MTSIECKEKSRVLGHQETLFLTLGQMKEPIGRYVHVNILESITRITLEQMRKVWQTVSINNFLMRACVGKNDEGNHVFKEMQQHLLDSEEGIDISEEIIKHEEQFHEVVAKEFERRINFTSGPLWNVKLLQLIDDGDDTNNTNNNSKTYKSVMLFFSSHIIIDAKCSVNLICNQVLPSLIGQSSSNPPIYFSQPMENAIYGMNEEECLISKRYVPWKWRAIVNVFMAKMSVGNLLSFSSPPKDQSSPPVLTRMQTFDIQEELTMNFLNVCKAKNVSVHSVLMIVVHSALHEARLKFGLSFLNTSDLLYPIDTRKFHPDLHSSPRMPLGDFHKIGTHRMKYIPIQTGNNEDEIFEFAKIVREGIQEQNQPTQENTGFDGLFHLLQKENLSTETFKALPAPCVFSNLGNCDSISKFDNNNNLSGVRLLKQYFSLETRTGCFISVWTFEKKMFFGITHGLGTEAGQYIAEAIPKNIETLAHMI